MAVIQMEKILYDDKIVTLPEPANEPQMSTSGNKSLIQLEATLLDMASTGDLCQGVLLICPIKVMDTYIVRSINPHTDHQLSNIFSYVQTINSLIICIFLKYIRYIESGCYRGFLKQVGLQQIASELNLETNNLLLWQVYTDADFT